MNEMTSVWPQLLVVGTLVGLVVLVLWIALPFAVFGIKPLLRQLLAEQKAQTVLLQRIADQAPRPELRAEARQAAAAPPRQPRP